MDNYEINKSFKTLLNAGIIRKIDLPFGSQIPAEAQFVIDDMIADPEFTALEGYCAKSIWVMRHPKVLGIDTNAKH